jgi:ABC-2 type transport system permease protein
MSGVGAGVLSAVARAQYTAMARLRWRMFVNGLRSKLGAFELGARTVVFVIYALMGLGLGATMGITSFLLVSYQKWQFLPMLFWAACILWQWLPIMLASFQEQFDLSILLRFPVSFGPYYLLYVVFGLADVSTILGGVCCLSIWTGVTLARPGLCAWTALVLAIFAAFNILLVRAIFSWIDRWLSQRKTREIMGLAFMVLFLSLQLLNPALHQKRHLGVNHQQQAEQIRQAEAKYGPLLKTADEVQSWLPPGLSARALEQADYAQPVEALVSLGVLGLWTLAAGGVLARRLRAEYRGEDLSSAPKRVIVAPVRANPVRRAAGWRLGGSSPVAALVEKEARSLMRTLPLMWAMIVPVLMVLVFASLFRNGGAGIPRISSQYALPLYVAYALLGFTQLFYNSLGTEGAGIQLLFLSPTPIRTIFLAKNILYSLLFAVDAVLAGFLASLRLGWPNGVVAAATVGWLLFALPCGLAAGNLFSLTMPFRVNPGRIGRKGGSHANVLSSLLVQFATVAVGAAVFWLCWYVGRLWLTVPIFLLLAGVGFLVWQRVLGKLDAIANRRRDELIATLMKAA